MIAPTPAEPLPRAGFWARYAAWSLDAACLLPLVLLLGASRSACGDIEGATRILEPLALEQPKSPAVQLELGIALGRGGRGDDAVAALRRAVALKPELPRAWQALGDHLSAVGDHKGAEAAYAAHLVHSVRDPQLMRAANALQAKRLPEAETLLRERETRQSERSQLKELPARHRVQVAHDVGLLVDQMNRVTPGVATGWTLFGPHS